MDKKNIQYGGGNSKIELCDILTTEKVYIHIKPYSGSATLSHLFNQAVVSAEVAFKYTKRRLEAIGCNVSVKRIRNLKSNKKGEK